MDTAPVAADPQRRVNAARTPTSPFSGVSSSTSADAEPCDRQPQPVDIKGWNVYAVDAHSLIFQVFHALPEMSSPVASRSGAVFGFIRDMLYLIEGKTGRLGMPFDLRPTFRDELFAEYKADRGEMPDSLSGQIPKIERESVGNWEFPVFDFPGFRGGRGAGHRRPPLR